MSAQVCALLATTVDGKGFGTFVGGQRQPGSTPTQQTGRGAEGA